MSQTRSHPSRRPVFRLLAPLLLACLALAFVGRGTAAESQAQQLPTALQQAINRFDQQVTERVARDNDGSIIVGVFKGNEMLWAKGFGWKDVEERIPATDEMVGRIGSVTKSFVSVALLQLVDRGGVQLDDPVEKWVPEASQVQRREDDWPEVTLRMLASMTSGWEREPRLSGHSNGPYHEWAQKTLECLPTTRYSHEPGTRYLYCNIGYATLGLAIERAGGQGFMDQVEERTFRPLGMTSSAFYVLDRPDLLARLTKGYTRSGGQISSAGPTRQHQGRGYRVPNGGIYSTVHDMMRYSYSLMGGGTQILSEASRREMFTRQPNANTYGLGWQVGARREDGGRIVSHGGSVSGYNAGLRFELNSQYGVAMLRSSSYNPPTSRLLTDILAATQ